MIQYATNEVKMENMGMKSMITVCVDSEKSKAAEKVFFGGQKGGIKLGMAEGKFKFAPDFDEKFDAMDAEIAELYSTEC